MWLNETDLEIRVVKIDGPHFIEMLGESTIQMLSAGNPEDASGYWKIKYVFSLFPTKAGQIHPQFVCRHVHFLKKLSQIQWQDPRQKLLPWCFDHQIGL